MNTTNTINVTAMTFAGLKLDVITGHPDHELLFIGKQVLDAAGLLNGSNALWRYKAALCLSDMPAQIAQTLVDYPRVQYKSKLIDEAVVYKILLRGHAPAAEPFRKWVTEEVLPTIRKTGSYNIEASTTPEATQFAGEFAAMRLMLDDLREEVAGLKQTILEWKIPAPMQVIAKSPYEGQAKANVFHSLTAKQYNECAENLNVSRLVSE
ncbi:hypothetical protein H4F51_15190 [Pectobacterium brasiliense]|uniref:BRO-N domain-containing protein n=1 Tax=Pectobacterium brasiliense TaxID=180957 RepID=UPI0015DDF43E|nr:BRO family protein [Pectobacterium brasiliense]MBA0196488.1 hypothetical protein [Pectobacterium brasiliense]MBN3093092.1 hypothetical protein [Pectobacterium brasiliense]MBN3141259.1 hypothetical protein [Pectobacterium brasiliense]MBW5896430.1 hypothetical protein [Pectobacterium brasiliense]